MDPVQRLPEVHEEGRERRPEQERENKSNWKAQIFWSHRTWEATVIEQVPDDRIMWRSKGQKGHVDGAVTFHELTPNLTRILLVLEYHPQGLFERTGNLWRAQGRPAPLELKHFRRHMMTEGILHADDLEGWRGTIHDGEVTESHERNAVAREQEESPRQSRPSKQSGNGRADGETRDESGDDETRDESGEREEASSEDGDQATLDDEDREDEDQARRDDEDRQARNGRAAWAGERSGARRASAPRPRSSAGTGNERRQHTVPRHSEEGDG